MKTKLKRLLFLLENPIDFTTLRQSLQIPRTMLVFHLYYLTKKGLATKIGKRGSYRYLLTDKGLKELTRMKMLDYIDSKINEVVNNE